MRKILWLGLLIIGLEVVSLSIPQGEPPKTPSSTVEPLSEKDVQYKFYKLESSLVHTLLIPAQSRLKVTPDISQKLSTLESFAQKHQATAAINGGFFDPQNQKSTVYVIRQGVLVADPRQNQLRRPVLSFLLVKN